VNFEETDYKEPLTIDTKAFESYAGILSKDDLNRYQRAMQSYAKNWREEFSVERVTQDLVGELNTFRYLPLKDVVIRVMPNDKLVDVLMTVTASKIARTPATVSIAADDEKLSVLQALPGDDFALKIQSDEEFVQDMENYYRVRCCSADLPMSYYEQAGKSGKYIATAKPLVEGRLELLHYLKEQSISYEYHRYGSFSEEDGKL
jgi:RHH-type proline utilization regulon transcriptional repressor/proline dehydrogenase/delta 1-pyrroline-5-carboxylate dehydrogenase